MGREAINYKDRFHDKYYIDDKTGCWIWNRALDRQGYGTISIGRYSKGTKRKVKAHRVSWWIHHGDIPNGLFVCHTCDNPSCVNPNHLYIGTHKQNQRDSVERLSHVSIGESNPKSKLKEKDVLDIYNSNKPNFNLSKIYNVSISTINRIKSKRSWRYLLCPR